MLFITAIISSGLLNPPETLSNELRVEKKKKPTCLRPCSSLSNHMDVWNKGRKRSENEKER